MNKFILVFLFIVSSLYAQRNDEQLAYFFNILDEPTLVISSTTSWGQEVKQGGYCAQEKVIYINPNYVDDTTLYLHEYVHYIIHQYKIDLQGYNEEYICHMIESIWHLKTRQIKSMKYSVGTFEKKNMNEYISLFNSIFK